MRARFITHKTITGEVIRVRSNKKLRIFTIDKGYSKYKTFPMSSEEFNNCMYNSGQDWEYFLRSTNDYYNV